MDFLGAVGDFVGSGGRTGRGGRLTSGIPKPKKIKTIQ